MCICLYIYYVFMYIRVYIYICDNIYIYGAIYLRLNLYTSYSVVCDAICIIHIYIYTYIVYRLIDHILSIYNVHHRRNRCGPAWPPEGWPGSCHADLGKSDATEVVLRIHIPSAVPRCPGARQIGEGTPKHVRKIKLCTIQEFRQAEISFPGLTRYCMYSLRPELLIIPLRWSLSTPRPHGGLPQNENHLCHLVVYQTCIFSWWLCTEVFSL